ncbi:hypothetical protein BdPhPhi1402_gp18 [Bdellovibrio phage phi1402]|uniref:hypothetical protein n=1 Tax=Bdellovibrio phage phi1402 TaxID=1035662 RepID=UPI000211A2D0|nr:hypothetical protein BdPhPhi1402_gp18 [Bdellovibrio phage phi1402]AEG42315.1 hypothetical protein [Bdellovibrio phage phi1402]
MRDFLNAILAFIVAESLTDEEFATCTATLPLYDQDTYADLSRVLASRESVSVYQDRLIAFYKAKGVDFEPAKTGTSNIFLGAVL